MRSRFGAVFNKDAAGSHHKQIRWQNHNQRGREHYSWHAPETECIGKGKAYKRYEFGTKVSITTTNPTGAAKAASLSSMPRRCPEVRSTGIPWPA